MNWKIRFLWCVALFLAVPAWPGSLHVSAAQTQPVRAEVIRYSSPAAGVTPEIPLNSQGLPAKPDEPQVLGASGRRTRPADDEGAGAQSSAADPLQFFDDYADCVKTVGFGFDALLKVPESYHHILIRGKADTMIEMVFRQEDGSYVLFRKGVGNADLANDVKDYDEAVALRLETGNYLLRYKGGELRSITCYDSSFSTAVVADQDLNVLCPDLAGPLTEALTLAGDSQQ